MRDFHELLDIATKSDERVTLRIGLMECWLQNYKEILNMLMEKFILELQIKEAARDTFKAELHYKLQVVHSRMVLQMHYLTKAENEILGLNEKNQVKKEDLEEFDTDSLPTA